MKSTAIKYIVAGLIVAALAGVQFFHELANDEVPICMGPQAQKEAFRDMLLQHLQSH
jgi:hypothetical protein